MDGKSRIEIDKTTLNIILEEFASNAERKVNYDQGEFTVNQGGLKVSLTHLPLKDTMLNVKGKFGTVNIGVADFKLEDSKVAVDFQVGLER